MRIQMLLRKLEVWKSLGGYKGNDNWNQKGGRGSAEK